MGLCCILAGEPLEDRRQTYTYLRFRDSPRYNRDIFAVLTNSPERWYQPYVNCKEAHNRIDQFEIAQQLRIISC